MTDQTAVLITSRNHPQHLSMTVLALARLAKRPDDLVFAIRADIDDGETVLAATRLKKLVNLELLVGQRPEAMGIEMNHLQRLVPEASYYHVLNDDVLPLTRDWDDAPFKAQKAVSSWNLVEAPGCPDYPVISRRWVEASGDELFTPYFPFWFDDRWLAEVDALVHGGLTPSLKIDLYTGKRGTQRFRDLQFWFEYYAALQDKRIAHAQRIVDYLGRDIDVRTERAELLIKIQAWHAGDLKDYLELPGVRSNAGTSDTGYLAAKDKAETVLAAAA